MTQINLSDAELLRLLVAGDEHAFVQIYNRYQGPVYRFGLLMTGRANIAEEVTQEVFLLLIREPHRYDPGLGPLLAYLYGVARNHVLRILKRERPLVPLPDEAGNGIPFAQLVAQDDPFGDYTRNEIVRLVREAVLTLPTRYREVIVLCDFQEMSYADAALALGCAIGTVNSRLHRGHALLLRKLRAVGELESSATGERRRCFA